MKISGSAFWNRLEGFWGKWFKASDQPETPFSEDIRDFAPAQQRAAGLPLVSVVIPCYNHGEVVGEAVESVLSQTWQDVEVWVVNDGSDQPETKQRLRNLQAPRTTVIHHRENQGLPAARNRGIRQANGRYVCCLDADDKLHPTYLEKALSLMESNLGVDFVYAWTQVFGDEDRVWYAPQFDPESLLKHNQLNPPAVFRRAAWEQVGGFREVMRAGYEDWEFWIRLAYHGYRGHRIPEKLIYVRRVGESFIHRAVGRHQELVRQIRALNPEIYADTSWLEEVLRGCDDRYVDRPFVNLRGQDVYQPFENPRLLVYEGSTQASSEDFQRLVEKIAAHRGEVVVVGLVPLGEEAADSLYRLTDYVYILPHFLPRYAWGEFLDVMSERVRKSSPAP